MLGRTVKELVVGDGPRLRKLADGAMHTLAKVSRSVAYRLGDEQLRARNYSEDTESLLRDAARDGGKVRFLSRYLDFATQKYGYESPLARQVADQLLAMPRATMPARLRKTLLSIKTLQGDTAQEERLLASLQADIRGGKLAPFLCDVVRREAPEIDHWRLERNQSIYARMMDTRSRLEALFRDDLDQICVVGNGPNEKGRARGAFVDSHSLVVRFNEYTVDQAGDYGTRTDVWVVNKGLLSVPRLKRERLSVPYWICASNNYQYKGEKAHSEMFEPWISGGHLGVIPPEVFQELIQRCDCLPSSGLAFLYWMYRTSGTRIDSQRLLGFSHLEGVGFGTHYFEREDADDPSRHIHDWDAEMDVFKEILR